jgi:hypothetical protein
MIIMALLVAAFAEPVVEVSGDVEVTIAADTSETTSADVDIVHADGVLQVVAKRAARSTARFPAPKLDKLIARDGARVTIKGFGGKTLHIVVSGRALVIVAGDGAGAVRIDGEGTSRVDTDGLRVDDAHVTLTDAARATVRATKSLTCDLRRASRLVVRGMPPRGEKKVHGVARLEM